MHFNFNMKKQEINLSDFILGIPLMYKVFVNLLGIYDNKDAEKKVGCEYLKSENDFKGDSYAKSHIKRRIEIINKDKEIECYYIGKTGSIETRNKKHLEDNDKMFLLYKTKSKKKINDFEAIYTSIYKTYEKCKNKKEGSASECSDNDDFYYLYICAKYKLIKK